MLGHCTGRLVTGNRGTRAQSQFDAQAVFEACAEHDVAVEINSRPERRDPPTKLLELARDLGCLFSIDSDAHAPGPARLPGLRRERAEAAGIEPTGSSTPGRATACWPGRTAVALRTMASAPEVEVRRSKRRRRTVSAYRDGDRVVVLIPASLSRKEEAEWVETMVARLERSEQRRSAQRRRADAPGAASSATKYLGGLATPDVGALGRQPERRAGARAPRATGRSGCPTRLQGMPPWVVDYVLVHELAHLLEAGHDAEVLGAGSTATRRPSGPRAT